MKRALYILVSSIFLISTLAVIYYCWTSMVVLGQALITETPVFSPENVSSYQKYMASWIVWVSSFFLMFQIGVPNED